MTYHEADDKARKQSKTSDKDIFVIKDNDAFIVKEFGDFDFFSAFIWTCYRNGDTVD